MALPISSVLFVVQGKGDRLIAGLHSFAGKPPLAIRRFTTYVCQNVAGLWLKYGAKLLKVEASLALRFPCMMRRFIDNDR